MSQTPFQSTLANASFKGFPFNTHEVELKGGRRAAPHQYPFRDSVYAEDLGRAMVCYGPSPQDVTYDNTTSQTNRSDSREVILRFRG
jgi:prophage DNA circulation protein